MINNPALPYSSDPGSGIGFFGMLIPALIAALLVIGAVVFLFMLLIGGVEWITAGGDKGKIENASTADVFCPSPTGKSQMAYG